MKSFIYVLATLLALSLAFSVVVVGDNETEQPQGQKYEFQAEVNRLLGLIINSLYTNKEIFLRELVSNASDALDKIRFMSLTNKDALSAEPNLEIKIRADKEKKILSIRDTGVGMTKEDLLNNLGTIARSGTKNFLEKVKEGADLNLIGQFGVGFYSAFLVADKLTVITKHNDDKQYIWESNADNTFTIREDPNGDTLKRGTEILLHLKDDATKYLDQEKLAGLLHKYSEFVHFPIQLYKTKEVEKEVPVEEEETKTEETKSEDKAADDTEKVDVTEEAEPEKPKTKKVKETVGAFETVNENKPIWTRSPKEVKQDEYNAFYKTINKQDGNDPLAHTHFTAEGQDVVFKSILFIPQSAPSIFDATTTVKTNIKLYVRKIFITDDFKDFLPRYLSFVNGVVDSDDLPLNVSREILQQSSLLRIIKKTLIKKVLELMKTLATKAEKASEQLEELEKELKDASDDKKKELEDKQASLKKDVEKYEKVWKEYGKHIRLGILEDKPNKDKLIKLLRYPTSKSGESTISLDKYVSRMAKNQKQIYYITGDSVEAVKNSPYLTELKKRDLEVIFMVDAIDEYAMMDLTSYEGKQFANILKEGLQLPEIEGKKKKEVNEDDWKQVKEAVKHILEKKKINKIEISKRFFDAPCILVTSSYGLTPNMEKIMKAQALTGNQAMFNLGNYILELNPRHPIMKHLKSVVEDKDVKDLPQEIVDSVTLMFNTAIMQSGYIMQEVNDFANSIFKSVERALQIPETEDLDEEEYEDIPAQTESSSSDSSSSSDDATDIKVDEDNSVPKEDETKDSETKDEL